MHLLTSFQSFIKTGNLFQPKDELLLAVSGGVDSVVLSDLCNRAGFNFNIAHCNFNLRGEESGRDEQFVRTLGEKYGRKVFVKKFDTAKYAKEHKTGIQEAARELRYQWFNEIINSQSSMAGDHTDFVHRSAVSTRYILTAHHANDNIETLLMNFFKGTGINGLRSILPKKGNLVRPLLFAAKEEIKAYADQNNLSFVEDSSNISDKYTRNFFRNQLIPAIKKVFPKVEDNLINNLGRFKEIEILYTQSISNHKKKLLEQKGEEVHIPVLKLMKTSPLRTVIYEIIKEFDFSPHQAGEVINLLQSETGRYIQSSSHKIIKNRNWLIISPANSLAAETILIEENDMAVRFNNGKLKIEKLPAVNYQLLTDSSIAMLDADEIKFPLLLRKWKQGDYFYPLGMRKKKKLSRFFIDQKMPQTEKENTWLIEMDRKIIWIVGKRIDDRCKIVPGTKNILKISLH